MAGKNFLNQFKNTRRQSRLWAGRPLGGLAGLQGRRPPVGAAGRKAATPPGKPSGGPGCGKPGAFPRSKRRGRHRG